MEAKKRKPLVLSPPLRCHLQDRQGELALIDRLLAHPQLSSAEFLQWKRAYQELFSHDVSPTASASPLEPGPPLTPSLTHTLSYIETHV